MWPAFDWRTDWMLSPINPCLYPGVGQIADDARGHTGAGRPARLHGADSPSLHAAARIIGALPARRDLRATLGDPKAAGRVDRRALLVLSAPRPRAEG